MVTAATHLKQHRFRSAERLRVLNQSLLRAAVEFGWQIEAWAVFSNHYHFVGHSPAERESADSLSAMMRELHKRTGTWVNHVGQAEGQRVWFNYWETRLTHQASYLARLNYVHQNAVRHGLVVQANEYPWCSARWFERTATPAQVVSIYRFKIDRVRIFDEYQPDLEW